MLRVRGVELSGVPEGLGFPNPVTAVISAGSVVVGTISDLPSDIKNAVEDAATRLFDEFSDLVGLFADGLKAGFGEVLAGVRQIAEVGWRAMVEACSVFRRFKDEINAGILVAQGDFASAAANTAIIAADHLGVKSPVPQRQSEITRAAEFVCRSLDEIANIAALAGNELPPVVRAETREEFILRVTRSQRLLSREPSRFTEPVRPPTAPRSSAPVVIGGAAVATALFLLAR